MIKDVNEIKNTSIFVEIILICFLINDICVNMTPFLFGIFLTIVVCLTLFFNISTNSNS